MHELGIVFEVVKVVGSGQEVLDSLKTESVDIILMDVRMPNMSGVDCTRIVKKEYPNIKVIILTTFEYMYLRGKKIFMML